MTRRSHRASGDKADNSQQAATPAAATTATDAFTVSALCPLCLTTPVTDPVLLHAGDDGGACVACRTCAVHWTPLLTTGGESTTPTCPQCGGGAMDCREEGKTFPSLVAMVSPPLVQLRNPVAHATTADGSGEFDLAKAIAAWHKRQAAEVQRECVEHPEEGTGVGDEDTLCGVCEEAAGPLWCLQCDFALCADCQATTHAKGRFKRHEVLPIAEARQRLQERRVRQQRTATSTAFTTAGGHAARTPPAINCGLHAHQPLNLYCRTCKECLCVTCCFGGDHRTHDVVPLTDIAEASRNDIRALSEDMTRAAETAARTSANLQSAEPEYARTVALVKSQIQDTFAELRRALTTREEDLVAQLRASATNVQRGVAAQTHLSNSIAAAIHSTTRKLTAFLIDVDSVTLMELLPALQRGHRRLHALASRLGSDAERAQRKLSARLREAAAGTPPAGADPVAVFRLFPDEGGEEGTLTAAVAEYATLLSSLGQLDAQCQYPPTEDTRAGEQVAAEALDRPLQQDEENYAISSPSHVTSGTGKTASGADERSTQEAAAHHPAKNRTPSLVSEGDGATAQKPAEHALVCDTSLFAVGLPASKPVATPASDGTAVPTERRTALSAVSWEADTRRTEAHFFPKPSPPTTDGDARPRLAMHPTKDKPQSAVSWPALSVEGGPVSGRKRLLDFSFDRIFGETLNAASSRNSESGLERFSNALQFNNSGSSGGPADKPEVLRQICDGGEPAMKTGRLDAAMDAFVGKTKSAAVSLTPEKKTGAETDKPKAVSGLHLQLRI